MSEVRAFQVPNGEIMKIGIDLHGVIDDDPKLFKKVMILMHSQDREVYIVSGPPKIDIVVELNELGFEKGVHYEEVYSIVDFLKESGVEMWQDGENRWWSNDEDWLSSKAKICNGLSLEYMLDDQEMYRPSFDSIRTKFVLYYRDQL